MAAQDQNRANMPFWDFIQSFDPSRAVPGQGVDHNAAPFPPFMAGFGFPWGGPGQHPHGPPHPPPSPHGHHHGPHPPPPPPGAGWGGDWGFGWGPWAGDDDEDAHGPWGRRGGHRHHHHGHGRGHGRGRHHRPGEGNDDDTQGETGTPVDAAADRSAPNDEKASASPDTMDQDFPDPAEVTPDEDEASPPPYGGPAAGGPSHGRRGHGRCRRGGGMGRGGWGRGPWGCRRGGGRHGGPPPFDFPGMMRGVMGHPFFQNLRDQAQRYATSAGGGYQPQDVREADDSNTFTPPVDVFNTQAAYVVHVALPGARKDDVGVTWNPDRGTLDVAGVVHRPGDEHFLETLASAERRVGLFERSVPLPPVGAGAGDSDADRPRDDVDAEHITARMEDGVLVVVVPKVEREWTEIRKVDIE
ncbi:HSP20-like chaperone [Purpureocillium lavendulum]|uniref:HSP20-like chaperone n=1 Tax=Purpureocillium lavendulum TaxID=1247861 RepID=A0AB34G614_9HYPO|nr:HSP20-like chaperone [Purpureocillium lavendulum]